MIKLVVNLDKKHYKLLKRLAKEYYGNEKRAISKVAEQGIELYYKKVKAED